MGVCSIYTHGITFVNIGMKSCKREIPFGAVVRGEGDVCSTISPHLMLDVSLYSHVQVHMALANMHSNWMSIASSGCESLIYFFNMLGCNDIIMVIL